MDRRNHKDLIVWQKSVELAARIHSATMGFPKSELFGLTIQIRRAAVSIPSNISEGAARGSTREFLRFMHIARGSYAELETQLILAGYFGYIQDLTSVDPLLIEVGKLINAVIVGLKKRQKRIASALSGPKSSPVR